MADNGAVLLQLDDVHTFYGAIEALKGVSLEVHEREIVTLIGANGAGKSTTLRSINGLIAPRTGKIVFQGTPAELTARGTDEGTGDAPLERGYTAVLAAARS